MPSVEGVPPAHVDHETFTFLTVSDFGLDLQLALIFQGRLSKVSIYTVDLDTQTLPGYDQNISVNLH